MVERKLYAVTAAKDKAASRPRAKAFSSPGTSEASVASAREAIATKVRELRNARRWTLAELSKHLQLSPNRLSEIERGAGSFTAEQFLLILQLFNVTVSDFVEVAVDSGPQLQNALARLGARHLHENPRVFPSAQLAALHDVIREALIDGAPRVITAIAPVLVHNAERLRMTTLHFELARLGLERRLAWVVANTLAALEQISAREVADPRAWTRLRRRAEVDLGMYLEFVSRPTGTASPLDALDPTIRSKRTLDEVHHSSTSLSHQWGIVSTLRPEDFAQALRAAHG